MLICSVTTTSLYANEGGGAVWLRWNQQKLFLRPVQAVHRDESCEIPAEFPHNKSPAYAYHIWAFYRKYCIFMRLPVRWGISQDLPQDHRHVAQCLPPGETPENHLQPGDHEQQQAGLYWYRWWFLKLSPVAKAPDIITVC